MMKALVLDGIRERARDGFLTRHFIESLRTPFARDYLIGHKRVRIADCGLRICFALINPQSAIYNPQ